MGDRAGLGWAGARASRPFGKELGRVAASGFARVT